MNRREFLSSGAAASLLPGVTAEPAGAAPVAGQRKRALMKVSADVPPTEAGMKAVARYGVKNVVSRAEIADGRLYATVEELSKLRDLAERNGISMDILTPPHLASSHIDREAHPGIMLGQSPERDREIEAFQTMIRNCAQVGIPCIKYNMSILGVLRMGRSPGRGDSTLSTFRIEGATPNPPMTRAGRVTPDLYWERITYFLERVVPVANEYKVRIACHPNDSPTPPEGYQGVNAVLSTVDGLKRFVSIKESPYHGLNFCQGTVSEMLQDPGREIFDVIRYFGTRGKIFNVHFRNIRGNRQAFVETGPDEGDVNFVRAMKLYREIGYAGNLQPDHVPQSPNDPGSERYFSFCYGYIRALIQAVDELD